MSKQQKGYLFYIFTGAFIILGIVALIIVLDRLKTVEARMQRLAQGTEHLAKGLAETLMIVSGQTEAIADHARALDSINESLEHREVVQ